MSDETKKVCSYISDSINQAFEIQKEVTAIPAMGPENGGAGEACRASWLENRLSACGIEEILRFDAPDSRVKEGFRPNMLAAVEGEKPEKLWLFAHLDTVPPGDLGSWSSDPWLAKRADDLVYGRGVEDNQQAIASMLILAEALHRCAVKPRRGLGLVFMSDEETGSKYGLQWILKEQGSLFSAADYYIVPDGGAPDGAFIETAEKGQMWIKFTITGRQRHASLADFSITDFANPYMDNSFVGASRLVVSLIKELPTRFNQIDEFFKPPFSTFVPTRHEENVDGVNISPGLDVFYLDCRLLPDLPFADVLSAVEAICASLMQINSSIKIAFEVVQKQEASSTPENSPVIRSLKKAIGKVYGVNAICGGIGGATVASFLRRKGLPAVVWSRLLNVCHQPDECSSLDSALKDAQVFARLIMED